MRAGGFAGNRPEVGRPTPPQKRPALVRKQQEFHLIAIVAAQIARRPVALVPNDGCLQFRPGVFQSLFPNSVHIETCTKIEGTVGFERFDKRLDHVRVRFVVVYECVWCLQLLAVICFIAATIRRVGDDEVDGFESGKDITAVFLINRTVTNDGFFQ